MSHTWGVGIVSTVILLGVIDDIQSRRYRNALFLFSLITVLFARVYFTGLSGALTGTITFCGVILVGLPLWKLRVFGAGDVKLFSVVGMASSWDSLVPIAIYSLMWGGVFAVTVLALNRRLFPMLNGWLRLKFESRVAIPFTVPILLGWLQWLSFNGGFL